MTSVRFRAVRRGRSIENSFCVIEIAAEEKQIPQNRHDHDGRLTDPFTLIGNGAVDHVLKAEAGDKRKYACSAQTSAKHLLLDEDVYRRLYSAGDFLTIECKERSTDFTPTT